jgi:hypothetical protein
MATGGRAGTWRGISSGSLEKTQRFSTKVAHNFQDKIAGPHNGVVTTQQPHYVQSVQNELEKHATKIT